MVQEKILPKLAPFVIGLLLVELGLFFYSFYDPAMGALDWFPYRGLSYFLLLFGVVALITGTVYMIASEMEVDGTPQEIKRQ